MVFFLHVNAWHSKPKVTSRCRHAANIAFDLFNIFLYVIARKVRKSPLSPFVTSNVVLSCLVRMADILARLVQKADSLSALQLTGVLFVKHTYPPPVFIPTPQPPLPHFLDRSAAPADKLSCSKLGVFISQFGLQILWLLLTRVQNYNKNNKKNNTTLIFIKWLYWLRKNYLTSCLKRLVNTCTIRGQTLVRCRKQITMLMELLALLLIII